MITHPHTTITLKRDDYTCTHTSQPLPYKEMITHAHTHLSHYPIER